MAEVGDIKPVPPPWPRRPGGKVEPGRRQSDTPEKERKRRRDDGEGGGDGGEDGHIDVYA